MSPSESEICRRFSQQASRYGELATLQRAVAWRLAHYATTLPLPKGPMADLGAGTGLLGQALALQAPQLSLLQVDGSPALLAQNPLARSTSKQLLWNLEQGLPAAVQQAALLTSSFCLQWLAHPCDSLCNWASALQPGGWLVLAVPVAGSFPQWHQAAAQAGVRCTARPLPDAEALIHAAARCLRLQQQHQLSFSHRYGPGGFGFLRHLRLLGADHSDAAGLSAAEWRSLLRHWPADDRVSWKVLLLVGQR